MISKFIPAHGKAIEISKAILPTNIMARGIHERFLRGNSLACHKVKADRKLIG